MLKMINKLLDKVIPEPTSQKAVIRVYADSIAKGAYVVCGYREDWSPLWSMSGIVENPVLELEKKIAADEPHFFDENGTPLEITRLEDHTNIEHWAKFRLDNPSR